MKIEVKKGVLIIDGKAIDRKKSIDLATKIVNFKGDEKLLMKDVDANSLDNLEKSYFEIAESFRILFFKNLEEIGARTTNVEFAKYKEWTTAIRLLIENDGASLKDLRLVFNFLKKNDFWKFNVQSTISLRKKFETIHLQAIVENQKNEKARNNTERKERGVSSDYLQNLYREINS